MGCIMLDLPELFAPAKIVSGLTSIFCLSVMDLKPATWISAMAGGITVPWALNCDISTLSCRVKQRLKLAHRFNKPIRSSEALGNFYHVTVSRQRRHF